MPIEAISNNLISCAYISTDFNYGFSDTRIVINEKGSVSYLPSNELLSSILNLFLISNIFILNLTKNYNGECILTVEFATVARETRVRLPPFALNNSRRITW